MRRWIRWAARLYPAAWRQRYGAEFDALLEDIRPQWRDGFDILRGALEAQMTTWSFWKLVGAVGVAGAILAGAVSVSMPNRYVSTAVMRMAQREGPGGPDDHTAEIQRMQRISRIQREILSRTSLAEIIQRPSLNLYRGERSRMPMEDIVENMRNRDIRIQVLDAPVAAGGSGPPAFAISFSYPDKLKAQAVVRALVTRFTEQNETAMRRMAQEKAGAPAGETLEVLDPPSLPEKPVSPNRLAFMACGLAAGLLIGVLAAVLRRRPVKWTLKIAGFAAAGFVVAGALSFLIPNRYISSAVMQITSRDPSDTQMAQRLQRIVQEVLSHNSLADIITQRPLDLYKKERARLPMEDVVQNMRNKDIRIQSLDMPAGRGQERRFPSAFLIQFACPDKYKAQAVVRELITRIFKQNVAAAQQAAREKAGVPAGETLEVLDPASLPERPASPNRLTLAALGFLAGLVLGGIMLRTRPRTAPA